jgi:anti-anti-sigma regulatory factor
LARDLHFLFPGGTYDWRRYGPENAGTSVNQMMKIQMKEFDDQLILLVEGRLAGPFVPELENCWEAARANQPNRKISVDLKSVTCIDRAGRYLLQSMHRNGVHFLRAGLAVQDILEQIMGQPECR